MSIIRGCIALGAACAAMLYVPVSFSHVSLAVKQAPIESRYQAVMRVPHGCKGSPTVKLRVRIPEGVVGVKPQPKAGWILETIKGDYAKPYALYGAQVGSGVREVIWSGGRLPDEHYDEFVFVAYLSNGLTAGNTLYFPVVQECEQGVERWIDTPGQDEKAPDDHSDSPAPGLKLLPKS
jgi:uncharacterized protein YcnI